MNYPKLFIGPMSKNIVDAVIESSEDINIPIGLIPSRRQIDYNGGYSNNWTTSDFANYVKEKTKLVMLERDHGGPAQGALNDYGFDSFYEDCKYMDLIHIDPWKSASDLNDGIEKTIKYLQFCFNINSSGKYEIGTEEAIFKYDPDELDYMLQCVQSRIPNIFNNVIYAVVQSGTAIVGTENVGIYSEKRLKDMIAVCNKFGLKSKEHNGDYLAANQIKSKFDIGLDAINIAPEFGVTETCIVLYYINQYDKIDLMQDWYNICYHNKQWKKWISPKLKYAMPSDARKGHATISQMEYLISISGHYTFSHYKYVMILKKLQRQYPNIQEDIKNKLKDKISSLLILLK